MASVPADIREGLAENLRVIKGVQVSAYLLAAPTPPCLQVLPGEVEYDKAMRRGEDSNFYKVQALVSLTSDIGSQQLLDELREGSGARSVKAAIEARPALGGACSDLHVQMLSELFTLRQEGRPETLACEWTVLVVTE
jgi:hypothetical protein